MLHIEHLKAGYGDRVIVDIPSLQLAESEHCLILGKSGSGKTTLLYAIAGLLTPLAGCVRMGDTDITSLSASARDTFRGKHIGIIYQTLHMVDALTVLENILLVPYAARLKQDVQKAEMLLQQLGLFDVRHRSPASLSQGQQQRVAIARAAIHGPALIVGDEPTSALDDESCATVMQLLLDTAKTAGASLLVATHDQRIKKYFAKTITVGDLV